ncbi:MAG: chloride channel protein [Acidimicrobiia bacterium]|nr:chloride channel protein [Acidimicrobiia bacterium]
MSLARRSLDALHLGGTPRLMALSGIVGIGAGLGAVLLIKAIAAVGWVAGKVGDATSLDRAWVFLTLPAGIWLAWRITAWLAPEVSGHGVPQIIAALTVRGGHIRARVMGLKTVATALTIGSGGSAGREGSIAQIGSSIGSWVARKAQLGENDIRVLVAAGAGAGISATFNAPIAGMFFAMEVILREFSSRHVHTIVVASVAGAVVSRSLIGEELAFSVPAYRLDDPRQLLLYGVLGLLTVAAAWLFLASLDWFEIVPGRLPAWVRPLVLAAVVATIGVVRPEILGSGQDFVGEVLRGAVDYAWWTLGLLAVLKAVATSATLGGKGSGGIFMPSLFIGAVAGSGFALLIDPIWNLSTINPGAFARVGMAATFSAVARAPLTSILIVFEITGDYGLVLPLMVAAAISTILAGRIRPESAYTAPLSRMGIHPVSGGVTDLLDTVHVADVVSRSFVSVAPTDTLGEVQATMQRNRLQGVPVTIDATLLGVVAASDVMRGGGPSDQVTAMDVMTPNPATVTMKTPVSEALERMAALGIGRLPVVDEEDSTQLVAMFRREDVVTAYHQALGATAQARTRPDQFGARTDGKTRFFESVIASGSLAEGRAVSEIPWPEGCVVVSVHRGSGLLVPNGRTIIRAGDTITTFGGEEARERLIERLAPPPEAEPEEGR